MLSKIKDFIDQLDQQPLAVDAGVPSAQQGVEAVFYAMYGGLSSWPELRDASPQRSSTGMALAAAAGRRLGIGGTAMATGSSMFFRVIRCLDSRAVARAA